MLTLIFVWPESTQVAVANWTAVNGKGQYECRREYTSTGDSDHVDSPHPSGLIRYETEHHPNCKPGKAQPEEIIADTKSPSYFLDDVCVRHGLPWKKLS
jgi:hypothetical protein